MFPRIIWCNQLWVLYRQFPFKRFQHPNYDEGIGFTPNDFAVVQTTDTPSGANISPGTIATSPVNPEVDGAITGWGRYCGRSNYSAILVSSAEREREKWGCYFTGTCDVPQSLLGADPIPIISDSECSSRYGSSFNSDNMICVWNGSQGACNVR